MTITKSILVVEDHPDMRELLGKQIEMMGFKIIVSKDGKEGLEKAVAQKPDLIMMDMMNARDGWLGGCTRSPRRSSNQSRSHSGDHGAIP